MTAQPGRTEQDRLHAVSVTLKEANAYVAQLHRHAPPVTQACFQAGVADPEQRLRGVVVVENPTAPAYQHRGVFEISRVCADGCPNACSFLYARATRAARELGFARGYTYTLQSESGASLRALKQLGWYEDAKRPGRDWAKESGREGRSSVSTPITRWRIDFRDELPTLEIPAEKPSAQGSLLEGIAA